MPVFVFIVLCTKKIYGIIITKSPKNQTNGSKSEGKGKEWKVGGGYDGCGHASSKKEYPKPLPGCRLYTNCKASFCAFDKSLESGAILGSDEVSTANVCPTDAVRPVVLLLHLKEINGRVQIPRLDLMTSRNKRLQ